MRGGALSDPTVVGSLQPFIVTSWHGHRDSPMPDVVRQELRDSRWHRGRESNVFLLAIDPSGRLVHAFDGFLRDGRPEGQSRYVLGEIERARRLLGLSERGRSSPARELVLPGLPDGERGVRVHVRLLDGLMSAYQAPVVEPVALGRTEWDALRHPDSARALPIEALEPALRQIFPPGVMERVDPRTKRVYRIDRVEGDLEIRPAGADAARRYALVSGRVTLHDEGPDDFRYEGDLEVVIAYAGGAGEVEWLRGTFDGVYPRQDPRRDDPREIRLIAALESIPR